MYFPFAGRGNLHKRWCPNHAVFTLSPPPSWISYDADCQRRGGLAGEPAREEQEVARENTGPGAHRSSAALCTYSGSWHAAHVEDFRTNSQSNSWSLWLSRRHVFFAILFDVYKLHRKLANKFSYSLFPECTQWNGQPNRAARNGTETKLNQRIGPGIRGLLDCWIAWDSRMRNACECAKWNCDQETKLCKYIYNAFLSAGQIRKLRNRFGNWISLRL